MGKTNSPASDSDRAAWVRENLPQCAAFAAACREVFGDVRMVYASENGHVIGQPGPEGISMAETEISGSWVQKPKGVSR